MKKLMKDRRKIKNYSLTIEGRTLKLKNRQKTVKLSKNQAKLILCLVNEIQEKKTIINYIWGKDNTETNESNYRQLVRRTREIFEKNGLPEDAIVTIPNYGLCINSNYQSQQHSHPECIDVI